MRYRTLIGTMAAALAAGAVFAQTPGTAAGQGLKARNPERPAEGFRRADTNGDGKVSFEEMKAQRPQITKERFDVLDRNHDGFVSPADRPEGSGVGAAARAGGDPDAHRQLTQSLMATDANHDGKVSFEEVTTAKPGFAKADFERADRDHDGFITAQDTPHAPQAGEAPHQPGGRRGAAGAEMREAAREKMRTADTNHDGYVSRAEAKVAMPGLTDERFNVMDRNHDGKIGPEDRPDGPRAGKGGVTPAKP